LSQLLRAGSMANRASERRSRRSSVGGLDIGKVPA
jgi:hypothetical protein